MDNFILSSAFHHVTFFAAEYECGAYGADTYNSAKSCAEITGQLTSTGYDIFVPLALGVLLVTLGLLQLLRTIRKKKASAPRA